MRIGAFGHCRGGELAWSFYEETGELAVRILWDDGSPEATLTVCLPKGGPDAGEDEIWVKTWSENEGVLTALKTAGIASPVGLAWHCGTVENLALLCHLSDAAIAEKDDAFRRNPDMATARELARDKAKKGASDGVSA